MFSNCREKVFLVVSFSLFFFLSTITCCHPENAPVLLAKPFMSNLCCCIVKHDLSHCHISFICVFFLLLCFAVLELLPCVLKVALHLWNVYENNRKMCGCYSHTLIWENVLMQCRNYCIIHVCLFFLDVWVWPFL